jgi:hypothetical protein
MSQSDILHKYLRMPKSNDGLARNEHAFYKSVWPKMEELRKKDRVISVFERMQFGKEIPIWQLK